MSFDFNPTFEDFISPYKQAAHDVKSVCNVKITESQHAIAQVYGFKDWQSFQYHLKKLHELLQKLPYTSTQWGAILNCVNGRAITFDECTKQRFMEDLVQADIYEPYFNELSNFNESRGEYVPSESMTSLLSNTQKLSDIEIQAVVAKALVFLKVTFFVRSKNGFLGRLEEAAYAKLKSNL